MEALESALRNSLRTSTCPSLVTIISGELLARKHDSGIQRCKMKTLSRCLAEAIEEAVNSPYGRPRCRPRIIMAQMTSLLKTLNLPLKLVFTVGYPKLRPTLP